MQSKVGTVDPHPVVEAARAAKAASGSLARRSTEEKNRALRAIARGIAERAGEILAANARDLDAARPLVEAGRMAGSVYSRLKLDEAKLRDMVSGIEQVASLDDPVGRITLATEGQPVVHRESLVLRRR